MTAINNTTVSANGILDRKRLDWYLDRVFEMERELYSSITSDSLQFIKFRLDDWSTDRRLDFYTKYQFKHMSEFIICVDEEFEEYAITEYNLHQLRIELMEMKSWLSALIHA